VDAFNTDYCSSDGVLFNKSTNTLVLCPGGKVGSYTTPNSVTNIGDSAFYFCFSLTSVTIGTNVASVGDYAFCDAGLTSVTIPNGVTSIGDEAFAGCTSLASVTIGNSVTNIGGGAFESCYSLISVMIPNSVTSIGGGEHSTTAAV